MISRENLNYQEKLILVLYYKLYGKQYECSDRSVNEQNIVQKHIEAQKVGFVFGLLGIPVGEYGFSWDVAGPYSYSLQTVLKSLDSKEALVKELYSKDIQMVLKELIGNDVQLNLIEKACQELSSVFQKDKGAELTGSMLYISNIVMPYHGMESVKKELTRRKKYFGEDKYQIMISDCWKKLAKLELVPNM